MSRKLLLVVLALLAIAVQGVQAQKLYKKANKQFELKAYNLAIVNYQKTLTEEDSENIEAKLKLAESYRRTNQPINAVMWYRKAGNHIKSYPDFMLSYAHTLKQIGKYSEAQELYWEFKQHDPIIGEHYAVSCDYAKNVLMEQDRYDLRLFGGNSKYSDYGVTFYNGKVVFSSFRKSLDGVAGDRDDSRINAKSKNRLVYATSDNPSMRDPLHLLRDALKDDENIGPISYATDMSRCAYTKNNFKDGFNYVGHQDNDMSIYFADATESGDFTESVPFKHNEVGYASGFPCLAFGGKALYYASNRPGGYGGYDIYVSYLKDGEWTYPENLGGQINTSGNEITPFFDGDKLYFSSDYIQGLGGFDVFKSQVNNGKWTYAENMGKGVNSLSDDYFFTINPKTKDYYLSSNRLGGRGKDDIYLATPIDVQDFASTETLVPTAVNLSDLKKLDQNITEGKVVAYEETLNIPKAYKLDDQVTPTTTESGKEVKTQVEAIPASSTILGTEVAGTEIVPERVKIDDYKEVPEAEKIPNTVIGASETTTKDVSLASTESTTIDIVTTAPAAEVTVVDARLIAIDEILSAANDVYFIQVAALFKSKVNIAEYNSLTKFGNLYKVYKTKSTKIRLGYYLDRTEAEAVLTDVKRMGYRDAFIAHEPLDIHEIQLAAEAITQKDPYASNYKVRLASYEDPQFFDITSVKGLGRVEQWTKKGWTIFVLSGYRTLEDAESARVKAINKGYTSAELVIDNNGILEKLVRN